MITLTLGLIQFIFAIGCLYYEDLHRRTISVYVLLACLIFDSMIMHEPFSELLRDQEREMMQFGGNFALGGCLLMLAGVRDLS